MERLHKEEIIDVRTLTDQKITFQISFKDGIPRSVVDLKNILKGPKTESLLNRRSGYQYIVDALKQVCDACDTYLALPETEKPTINGRSLWSYAVIQYCKCYSRNEGWTVTLEESATIKNESEIMKNGHRWFMDQRHTFVAHGGKSTSQNSIVCVIKRNDSPYQIESTFTHSVIAAAPQDEAIVNLKHLAEIAIKYVEETIPSLERKIFLALIEAGQVLSPELIEKFNLAKPTH